MSTTTSFAEALRKEMEAHGLPKPEVFYGMGFTTMDEWREHQKKKAARRAQAKRVLSQYGSWAAYWTAKEQEEERAKELLAKMFPDKPEYRKLAREIEREHAKGADLNEVFGQ